MDQINPLHYKGGPLEGECIDYSRQMGFSQGNAFKYVWRAGHKGVPEVDLAKALWYLDDLCGDDAADWITSVLVPLPDAFSTKRAHLLYAIARGSAHSLAAAADMVEQAIEFSDPMIYLEARV